MNENVIVAFDVGNTRTKCAVLDGDTPSRLFNVQTTPVETLAKRLENARATHDVGIPQNCDAIVSSVCPDANDAVLEFWQKTAGTRMRLFDDDIPLVTTVDQPDQVGTDRLLCALGAREIRGAPVIVVMAGTAITVDLVDDRGRFSGGAICPGYRLCAEALQTGTACLPLVKIQKPAHPVGKNTQQAILTGLDHFCRGGVQSLIQDLRRQVEGDLSILITGGDAKRLLPLNLDLEVNYRPDLIFEGIYAAVKMSSSTFSH